MGECLLLIVLFSEPYADWLGMLMFMQSLVPHKDHIVKTGSP